jgi:hypothetical protein
VLIFLREGTSPMSIEAQSGLVGFFDILGYENLLSKNEPEDIAEKIFPVLMEKGEKVLSEIKSIFAANLPEYEKAVDSIINSIKWLAFSDTILLTLEFEKNRGDNFILLSWMSFFLSCIELQCTFFRIGLPLRGAIDYGKYVVKENFFAGKPIVNCYRSCNKLELAACVLCEEATKQIDLFDESKSLNFDFSVKNNFITEYLVQLKSEEKRMFLLCARTYDQHGPELRSQVLRSFSKNNKDIPYSAQQKVLNTEQWLHFLREKMED